MRSDLMVGGDFRIVFESEGRKIADRRWPGLPIPGDHIVLEPEMTGATYRVVRRTWGKTPSNPVLPNWVHIEIERIDIPLAEG